MRLFIAIELIEENKKELAGLINTFSHLGADVNPVRDRSPLGDRSVSLIKMKHPSTFEHKLTQTNGTARISNGVKWVETENLHISLKFLADAPDDKIGSIKEALDEVCKKHRNFMIKISSIGCFPSPRNPRVIWVGVDEGNDQIKSIEGALERRLETIGFPAEERPYHPHITLGRVRSAKNCDSLKKALQKTSFVSSHPFMVDRVVLFKSSLTPKGPIYTPIHISRFPL